jgi:hypothetical protein
MLGTSHLWAIYAKDLVNYILYCGVLTWWESSTVQRGKKECVPLCSTTHITQSLMKPKLWMAVDLQACIYLKDTYSPVELCCSAHISLDSPSPLHSVQQLGLPDASYGWSGPAPKKRVLRKNAFYCMSTSITKNAILCKRLLPCWSLQRNLIVAVGIIDAHNAPITTFFQSKKNLSSGQQIVLPQSPRLP